MAGESHTVRLNIDGSGARRGAATYEAAINKIAAATKTLDKHLQAASASMNKSGAFNKIARDLASLNNLRLNPNLARNLTALSSAIATMRSPSAQSLRNVAGFLRTIERAQINTTVVRNLAAFSTAMANFRGPSRQSAQNVNMFFRALAMARINPSVAQSLSAVSAAMANFRAPSAAAVRNFQQFAHALSTLRVPPGINQIGYALYNMNRHFARSQAGVNSFGGSLRNVPWAAGSAGAMRLTGSLRGLENAFSLTYQAGSQLRVLLGSLTFAGLTSGVYEATLAFDRFHTTLGVTATSTEQLETTIENVRKVAYRFGLDIGSVYQEFGKFATAAGIAGASMEEITYIFNSVAQASRVMGLSVYDQNLVFQALTQMFSKGRIQSEELRRQLSERLPGAFQLTQEAVRELTGDANASLDEMLKLGQVGPGVLLLMSKYLNREFGAAAENAANRADAAMGRMRSSFTDLLKAIGQGGAFEAIGVFADTLYDKLMMIGEDGVPVLREEFQQLANDIGRGLADAVAMLTKAAAWAMDNIRMIGQVAVAALGGAAGRQIAAAATSLLALALNAGRAVTVMMGFGRVAPGVSRLGMAFGLLGGAITTAAMIGGAALASVWNETVKVGDQTATVGQIAAVVWNDFQNWVASVVTTVIQGFPTMMASVNAFFASINEQMGTQGATWQDWTKAILGSIYLVGNTMKGVFELVFQVLFGGAKALGELIANLLTGLIGGFAALGDALSGNFEEAGRKVGIAWGALTRTVTGPMEYFEGVGEKFADVMITADRETQEFLKGEGLIDKMWASGERAVTDYANHLEQELARINTLQTETFTPTLPPSVDLNVDDLIANSTLDFITGSEDGEGKDSVSKRLKSAQDALRDFNAEQAVFKAMLDSGRISLGQYNAAVDHLKRNLEDIVDPYAAMVRSMQEEINYARMSNREARTTQEFLRRRNELLDKGVVLTDAQTEALKGLVEQLDRIQNPSPLQAWIDGMEDFGDAIESAGVRAMEGLSDALADLIVDGKADWESLFKSILKDLIKIGLNEVWKSLFGGNQTQINIAAPMSGVEAQALLSNSPTTPANNAQVMATAVAQGLSMSGWSPTGGLSEAGLLGDLGTTGNPISTDIGSLLTSPGAPGLPGTVVAPNMPNLGTGGLGTGTGIDAILPGLLTGAGGLPGVVTGSPSTGGGIPLPRRRPSTRPQWERDLAAGAGQVAEFGQGLNDLGTGVQQGFNALNDGMSSFAEGIAGIFGGGNKGSSAFSGISDLVGGGAGQVAGPGSWLTGGAFPSTASGASLSPSMFTGIPSLAPNITDLMSGGGMLNLSNRDIELMARVAGTEWARGAGPGQLNGILDTMMNRAMTPGNEYGQLGGMEGVLNKRWQFSAINSNLPGAYGTAANAPLDPKVLQMTQDYLAQRAGGLPSSVGASTHYLNPAYSSQNSLNQWGNNVVGQAQQSGYMFGTGDAMHYHGVAPGSSTPGAYGIGLPGGMGQPTTAFGMDQGYGAGMSLTGQPGFGSMINPGGMTGSSGFSSLPGGMSIPQGTGSGMGGGSFQDASGMMGGDSIQGLGQQFTSEMQGSFSELSQQFPESMEPGLDQTAQLLPQKMTESDGFSEQMTTAMQPATQQTAQNFQQQFSAVIQQLAQEMHQAMSQAIQSASMSGGGGGMMGMFGMFKAGGIVGGGGQTAVAHASMWHGARSMATGGIVGDPDAEPIIAHKGELVVPSDQVEAMRRMGRDVAMFDNAAVRAHERRAGASSGGWSVDGNNEDAYSGTGMRPIVNNWTINTPDADSFKRSQSQIEARMGAAQYRSARRNN